MTGCGSGGGSGGFSTGGFEGQAIFGNPNFNIDVSSVVIGPDLRPEVTFTATDDNGFMIPLNEFTDARFILATLQRTSVGAAFQFSSFSTQIESADGGNEAT